MLGNDPSLWLGHRIVLDFKEEHLQRTRLSNNEQHLSLFQSDYLVMPIARAVLSCFSSPCTYGDRSLPVLLHLSSESTGKREGGGEEKAMSGQQ